MATLIKGRTTAGSKPAGRAGGGFKFQYRQRNPDAVKERASRSLGGRDSYFAQEVQFFTAREGSNTVRILPPPPDAEWGHYGIVIFAHYEIGADKSAYLCLNKMKNEPCPICEEREAANSAGEDELAKALRPGERVAVYVIDRSQESKGVLLWNMSASMDKDITKLCIDPGTGEVLAVDDPQNGYDFSVTREGTGLKSKYRGHQFARRESPLVDDAATSDKYLQFVCEHPLDKLLVYHDYAYIKRVLDGQAPNGDEAEPASAPAKQPAPATDRPSLTRRPAAPTPPVTPPAQETQAAETDPNSELPSYDDLTAMDENMLADLVEDFQLDAPQDGFNSVNELRVWIAEALGITPPAPAPAPTPAPAASKGNWKDRLAKMQGK